MAKRYPKKKGFSLTDFDIAAYKNTEAYVNAIDALYMAAVDDFARMGDGIKLDPSRPFSFNDYPSAKRKAQQIIADLTSNMHSVIIEGTKKQWDAANAKNNAFLGNIFDTTAIPKKTLAKYQNRNLDALKTFQTRKTNGLDLSRRVWNYTDQLKGQMELALDIGIGDGRSGKTLARDLKQYLVDPDKLFRRVRDKHGNLVLSKNAKAFHPGQGKYRSSHKNALRLARTEINTAYRESDYLRWQQMDFVVGYEVKLSNNHPVMDICDSLKGKYPKEFKFVGWHPQCRCFAIPILMDMDEFDTDELNELKAAINGTEYKAFASRNTVTDVPENFKEWVNDNKERAKGWTSQPYFIRDNFKGGTIAGGLSIDTTRRVISAPAPASNPAPAPAAPNVDKPKADKSPYDNVVATEEKIRKNKKFETAVAFDQNGNEIYSQKGQATSVQMNTNDLLKMKDAIFTHNHPRGWGFAADKLGRIGNSFSINDVMLAARYDMAEMRAVTPLYTFVIKRPKDGWGSLDKISQTYRKHDDKLRSEYQKIIEKSSDDMQDKNIERATNIHYHALWKRVCKELGIEYSKAKTA